MPQTSYALERTVAVAGQVVELGRKSARYRASEEIPAGRYVELHTDNTLRLYRGGKKYGISMYRDAKEPGAWAIDDYVPVLRAGQIWADFDGTAASAGDLDDANVHGADTTATKRGKITQAAVSYAADAQVYNGGPAKFCQAPTGNTGLALVEINLPADDQPMDPVGTMPGQVGNDFILTAAGVIQNAVYDLPATAAASTVTLPAAAPDGTKITVVADGTKNGHTVQYRDATGPTNLTTALLASKRHLAVCEKMLGKWFVNVYVAP